MTQVRAVDRDAEDGPGPNGQVTYSIVSQHNKFTIDSNTGDLYTNAVRIAKTNETDTEFLSETKLVPLCEEFRN